MSSTSAMTPSVNLVAEEAHKEFEYSIPVRRRNKRLLAPIPAEIYDKIYSYLEPSQETSPAKSRELFENLAGVCRHFCVESILRLYGSLVLSGLDSHTQKGSHGRFCSTLVGANLRLSEKTKRTAEMDFALQIAPRVRECTFRDWLPSARLILLAEMYLSTDARAAQLFENVSKINLIDTPITPELIQMVYKIRSTLTHLSIHRCPLQARLTKDHNAYLSNLTLSSFELFVPQSESFDLSPECLRLKDLQTLRTDSPRLTDFFLRRAHPFLRCLDLRDVQDLDILFLRLDRCPTLTELTISNVMRPFGGGQTKVPALSPNALPNLESLSIPALLLNSCMRGTVRKLSLLGAERDYDGPEADVGLGPGEGFLYSALPLLAPEKILALTKSNDVTEVHLPQHLFFEFPLHKYFPRLEVLLLSWCHPNFPLFMPGLRSLTSTHPIHKTILTPLCKQWPAGSFARLRELRLQFIDNLESKIQGETVNWELNDERALIEEHISPVFPQLLLFTRVPVFVWDREFLSAPWRAFMPHEYEDMTGREAGYQDI